MKLNPLHVRKPKSRPATVLICVLACAIVVMGMVAAALQGALLVRREARTEHALLQTQFVCEAGAQRAHRKLQSDREYAGETWTPAITGSSFTACEVSIRVERSSDKQPTALNVTAKLFEPSHDLAGLQRSFIFHILAESN